MRLVTARTVEHFANEHADARQALADWVAVVKAARWTSPDDAKRSLPGTRPIGGKRLIFNILDNRYRIVCEVNFANEMYKGILKIQFIGTHAEYNRIDATTVTLPTNLT